jgi:hypothetical protein
MTQELTNPLQEKTNEVNEQISRLARHMCNFANLNPNFKSGGRDYVRIEAEEGDRTQPEFPYDVYVDESEHSIPEASFTYKFEAKRERYYVEEDEKYVQKAHLLFILSIIGINERVLLPQQMAEDVMGLPGEEAVREVGPVTLVATTMFALGTGNGNFSVCDHMEYKDADGEALVEAPCSCENNNVMYVPEHEVDDGDVIIREDGITQYASTDLLQKSKNEVIIYDDLEVAVTHWRDMIHIGEEIDVDMKLERLNRAIHTFNVVLRAVWTQAGLTSPQQAELAARLQRS